MLYITGLFRQWSDGQGIIPPPPPVVVPDVGGIHRGPKQRGARRQRYLIEGRHLLLTEDELRAYLARLLRRKQAQQAQAPKPQQAKPAPKAPDEPIAVPGADFGLLSPQMQALPTYVQIADDLAHQPWARSQPEIIGVLQQLALGMEADADEEDVEFLLLM